MIVNVPIGKSFVIHFDYTINETRQVRLSLSNIYKEFKVILFLILNFSIKNLNGNSI